MGGDHFAMTTPFGPKIDQHRGAGLQDVLVKRSVGYVLNEIAGHGGSSCKLSLVGYIQLPMSNCDRNRWGVTPLLGHP